jgi:phosphatidylserine/phosphatidylglycerophosphate/cardiolipin synthase-like enzyme
MRFWLYLLLLFFVLNVKADAFSTQAVYQVCFTPAQQCRHKITHYIADAQHSIEVQAYSFTSKAIAYALIKAQKRGVKVSVIIDKSELLQKSRVYLLLRYHIPLWLDDKVAIAHNKVMIFDGRAVLTGSYNFTNAAEYKNAENMLYIEDSSLAKRYYQNWQQRLQQSKPVTRSDLAKLREHLKKLSN